MDKQRSPNDLNQAVPKFCLALEEFRRTNEGRVRTPQEFLQHFFPHDSSKVTDRLFKFLPNEVRGPVLTTWGLRGAKSALKDTDEKVQSVVWDALNAGDIDHEAFESALVGDMIVRWAPLPEWWTFWRGGKLSKLAIHKALDSAYELALFDAKWFFDTIEGPQGKLRGTDVVSEGLTKAELTEWVRKIHASGDGSPKGMLAAIGWDRIVGKTPNDVLVKVLDAFAQKVKLVDAAAASAPGSGEFVEERPSTRITPVPPAPGAQHPADLAESTLMNAVVGGTRSGPPGQKISTVPSSVDKQVDDLFSESQMPPADEHEQIVVVEDEIDMAGASNESSPPDASPTNRPPPSGVEAEPMLLKARPPLPSSPPAPPQARRR